MFTSLHFTSPSLPSSTNKRNHPPFSPPPSKKLKLAKPKRKKAIIPKKENGITNPKHYIPPSFSHKQPPSKAYSPILRIRDASSKNQGIRLISEGDDFSQKCKAANYEREKEKKKIFKLRPMSRRRPHGALEKIKIKIEKEKEREEKKEALQKGTKKLKRDSKETEGWVDFKGERIDKKKVVNKRSCERCKMVGHNEKDCLAPKRCFHCGKSGHTKRYCARWKCSNCRRLGHKRDDCPLRRKKSGELFFMSPAS